MYCFPVLLRVGLVPKIQNLNWSGITPQKAKFKLEWDCSPKGKIKLEWDYSQKGKN